MRWPEETKCVHFNKTWFLFQFNKIVFITVWSVKSVHLTIETESRGCLLRMIPDKPILSTSSHGMVSIWYLGLCGRFRADQTVSARNVEMSHKPERNADLFSQVPVPPAPTVTVCVDPELWLVLVWLIAIMRDVLVLISFDTLKFITPIKVRGNHKIVSNIWDSSWEIKLSQAGLVQEDHSYHHW